VTSPTASAPASPGRSWPARVPVAPVAILAVVAVLALFSGHPFHFAWLLWGSIAIICAAGSVGEWLIGVDGGAILCLVIAVGSGWYDYRVWTSRSRRLIV
jgi:hypothetical protein